MTSILGLSGSQVPDFAVLGDPVSHSLSPRMHGAGFAAQGLDLNYGRLHVRRGELGDALAECFDAGMRGLNLTVPHKVAALEHLESVDEVAARIGAVNTLVRGAAGWVGHNTDAPGFVRALRAMDPAPPRCVRVLGAGGAALAIVHGLRAAFGELDLAVVTRRAHDPSPAWQGVERIDYASVVEQAGLADLWVNATTVGMQKGPKQFPVELPVDRMPARTRVVDIVYPRPAGGLLDRAEARGLAVQDGREMLLWQGVIAQELWLEATQLAQSAVEAMRAALA